MSIPRVSHCQSLYWNGVSDSMLQNRLSAGIPFLEAGGESSGMLGGLRPARSFHPVFLSLHLHQQQRSPVCLRLP